MASQKNRLKAREPHVQSTCHWGANNLHLHFHCPNNMRRGNNMLPKRRNDWPSRVFVHDDEKIFALHTEQVSCNTFRRTRCMSFHNKRLVNLGGLAFCTTLALLHNCTDILRDVASKQYGELAEGCGPVPDEKHAVLLTPVCASHVASPSAD